MGRTAVLLSGGLDSAVLAAEQNAQPRYAPIQPIYVSVGLAWEEAERAMLAALLAAEPLRSRVLPLVVLTVDMRDVYAATHWAVQGRPPEYHTPDEDVYLPGRNIILLGKAGVFCAATQINRLVLGTLGHNPFPDATPEFRSTMADALSLGLAHPLVIDAPYSDVSKSEVVRRGAALGVPFELTLSCMNPVYPKGFGIRDLGFDRDSGFDRAGSHESRPAESGAADSRVPNHKSPPGLSLHCGLCSKCRERHDAFIETGLADPTEYADERYVNA
jgi:7-cyano-7-deazaguanine synthase